MDDLDKLLCELQDPQSKSQPEINRNESILDRAPLKLLEEMEGMVKVSVPRQPKGARTIEKLSSEKLLETKKFFEFGTITQAKKLCVACGESINKGGAILNGKSYHKEHFCCNLCNTNLKGALVFEKNDLLWCEQDYHSTFSPTCFYCKEPIKEENGIEALGKTFHPDHFFCAQCGDSLVNKTFREYQGKAFCSDDYATLFASRCAQCLQPLLEDYISALNKNYHKNHFLCSVKDCGKILAANGFYNQDDMPYCEYHYYQLSDNICSACDGIILGRCILAFGKKFHTAHFKCSFCQKELDGIEGGYKNKGGKPYCPGCYMKVFS